MYICIYVYSREETTIPEQADQWAAALGMLGRMRLNRLDPDLVTYSAAISACSKGGHWEQALRVLRVMRADAVEPNAQSLSAALSASERGSRSAPSLLYSVCMYVSLSIYIYIYR